MEDLHIYQLAEDVIGKICDDINESLYAGVGSPLRVVWSPEPKFGAWASSAGAPTAPPEHKIGLHYQLARQIYRDCEDFLQFSTSELQEDRYQHLFATQDPYPPIPACFSLEQSTHTMFVASLTWVFFHELGHLIQEHGYIRSLSGIAPVDGSYVVSDCDVSSGPPLSGRQSQISHATELAADFEASFLCLAELVRQFSDERVVGATPDGSQFIGASYLYVCGVACVFYRFNGGNFGERASVAYGSHPQPLYRLEGILPSLYELAESDFVQNETGHSLDRRGLVHVYGRAAYSVAFFWLYRSLGERGPLENYLPTGILNSAPMMEYTRQIITVWDEIKPQVEEVRRINNPLSLMQFADDLRNRLGLYT